MTLIIRTLIKNANREVYGFNLLDRWLKEVDKYADKIVMIDDNSDDGTFEKCRDYSDKITIKRTEMKDFYTQEQWMQNELWLMVGKFAKIGDWILALDSDELLESSFVSMKDIIMGIGGHKCYSLQFTHIWTPGHFRIGKYWGGAWTPRMFRYHALPMKTQLLPGIHMSGIPLYVKCFTPIPLSCAVMHYGYATDEVRKFKSEKYLKYSKQGGDIQCAKSVLEKPILVKLSDRLDIMKKMQLNPILSKKQQQNFIRKMGEVAIQS